MAERRVALFAMSLKYFVNKLEDLYMNMIHVYKERCMLTTEELLLLHSEK